MNIDKLRDIVKNRIPKPLDISGNYAVLIPLICNKGRWEIIYELRSKKMKTQPGEVSFPGGKLEKDETFEQAAIRETVEELGIREDNIEIIGELDFLVSYSNLVIHCFLGLIDGVDLDHIKVNPDEVDHIFSLPIDFLLETQPNMHELSLRTEESESFPYDLIPRGRKYKFREAKNQVYFYHYNGYTIWGFTARMTKQFVEIIETL